MQKQHKILVVGDVCRDIFIYGKCDRLCPEAPVPVFIPHYTEENMGMAGNTFQNVVSINGACDFISNKRVITKTRYVDEYTNQMLVRVDSDKDAVDRIDVRQIDLKIYDAIIISDYCKGSLYEKDIEHICNNHDLVFLDTKKYLGTYCNKIKFIKINESEYNKNEKFLNTVSNYEEKLIVTLGHRGCRYKDKIKPVSKVDVKDMSGAGDTFMAALCVEYLNTKNIDLSMEFANLCATQVVQLRGVRIAKRNE